MRKIIVAILTLALLVALCACGNSNADSTENASTNAQTTEATESTSSTTIETSPSEETTAETESEEEKAQKEAQARYEKATEYLVEYLKNGSFRDADWNTYSKNDALEYLYKEFEALGDYEDSAEILSRFTVFPNMLTSITNAQTDHLGNRKESEYASYQYDEKGTSNDAPILKVLGIDAWSHNFQYEYDPADRIISIKLLSGGVYAIVTPEYNANGNIVKATIQTNTDTYTSTYTYDEQNRLIAAEKYTYNGGEAYDGEYWKLYSRTYTYDVNSNLAEEKYSVTLYGSKRDMTIKYSYYENGDLQKKETNEYDYNWKTEFATESTYAYEYDVNGHLLMEKKNHISALGTSDKSLIYTNDENGRPITAELIETKDGKNDYASQILTYHYETLYFYATES